LKFFRIQIINYLSKKFLVGFLFKENFEDQNILFEYSFIQTPAWIHPNASGSIAIKKTLITSCVMLCVLFASWMQ